MESFSVRRSAFGVVFSAAADGDDDFDFVVFVEEGFGLLFAEDNFFVSFDGVGGGFDFAEFDELRDGGVGGNFVVAAVENDLHGGIIGIWRGGLKRANSLQSFIARRQPFSYGMAPSSD